MEGLGFRVNLSHVGSKPQAVLLVSTLDLSKQVKQWPKLRKLSNRPSWYILGVQAIA